MTSQLIRSINRKYPAENNTAPEEDKPIHRKQKCNYESKCMFPIREKIQKCDFSIKCMFTLKFIHAKLQKCSYGVKCMFPINQKCNFSIGCIFTPKFIYTKLQKCSYGVRCMFLIKQKIQKCGCEVKCMFDISGCGEKYSHITSMRSIYHKRVSGIGGRIWKYSHKFHYIFPAMKLHWFCNISVFVPGLLTYKKIQYSHTVIIKKQLKTYTNITLDFIRAIRSHLNFIRSIVYLYTGVHNYKNRGTIPIILFSDNKINWKTMIFRSKYSHLYPPHFSHKIRNVSKTENVEQKITPYIQSPPTEFQSTPQPTYFIIPRMMI